MSRDHLDRYYTPAWPTEALLRRLPLREGDTILEPCAGQGGIARVLERHGHQVITGDFDPEAPVDHHWDWTQAYLHPGRYRERIDQNIGWIITNPPYAVAEAIVRASRGICPRVAVLLRLTWLEPVSSRQDLLNDLARVIVTPRVSYTGDGATDSTGSAWFIWTQARRRRASSDRTLLDFIPQSERPPRTERRHRPLGRGQDPRQLGLLGGTP